MLLAIKLIEGRDRSYIEEIANIIGKGKINLPKNKMYMNYKGYKVECLYLNEEQFKEYQNLKEDILFSKDKSSYTETKKKLFSYIIGEIKDPVYKSLFYHSKSNTCKMITCKINEYWNLLDITEQPLYFKAFEEFIKAKLFKLKNPIYGVNWIVLQKDDWSYELFTDKEVKDILQKYGNIEVSCDNARKYMKTYHHRYNMKGNGNLKDFVNFAMNQKEVCIDENKTSNISIVLSSQSFKIIQSLKENNKSFDLEEYINNLILKDC